MQTMYGNINWHKIQHYKTTILGIPNKAKQILQLSNFSKTVKGQLGFHHFITRFFCQIQVAPEKRTSLQGSSGHVIRTKTVKTQFLRVRFSLCLLVKPVIFTKHVYIAK